ncbi:MAG: ABC transporter permease [Hyphomicrobiaceae bacterium]
MPTLDIKLLRDLAHMWGQALAIALVLAAGVATLVLASGAYRSLFETRAAYYERYRFGDIFATARRAPNHLKQRIALIPGVSTVETRIASSAILSVEAMSQPATGQVLSLPADGPPRLNALKMRSGRLPDPHRDDEVVINEAFANAHEFQLGDSFQAILNGRKKELRIVAIALSPEYIYALGPGDLVPDDRRFAVIWMAKNAAEAAYDLKGAFNFVTLSLRRDANRAEVIERLDTILEPYGGRGAYDRDDQRSHAFIDTELKQLRTMSIIVPPIFLAVAAFLINMTLARLIAMEREQIGLLKAVGYSVFAVALHYFKLVTLIAVLGIAIGFLAGIWLGRGLTELYGDFFHFPFLVFLNPPEVFIIAATISLLAAWLGALRAVGQAVYLSPAVAMAPPAPARYRHDWWEKTGLLRDLSQPTMMIIRHLVHHPWRAGLTVLGIASSGALLVMSLATNDSINFMIDVTFFRSSRQDITVNFTDIRPIRVAHDLAAMPGVMRVEPFRQMPVTLHNGHRSKRVSLDGVTSNADLNKLLARDLNPLAVPDAGIAIGVKLAEILNVGIGERIVVEARDARRRRITVPVTAVLQGFLDLEIGCGGERPSPSKAFR